MFINYQVGECKNCDSIKATIQQLELRLSSLSTGLYNEYVFLSPFSLNRTAKDLIYYKHILNKLLANSKYYEGYSYKQIVSKVKTLI